MLCMPKGPIGIFDSGLGSYNIVQRVRNRYPEADILYLADRASFPYGGKTDKDLEAITFATIGYLRRSYSCDQIVIASNTPSLLCLERVRASFFDVKIDGILPPVRSAEQLSTSGSVAILVVKAVAQSKALRVHIERQKQREHTRVHVIDASPLVDLVERGRFATEVERTHHAVHKCIGTIRQVCPDVDTITLSSTHLSWLFPYFKSVASDMNIIDPADELVEQIGPLKSGARKTVALVTENGEYPFRPFADLLTNMDAEMPIININKIPMLH